MKENGNIPSIEELKAIAENQQIGKWQDDAFVQDAREGIRLMDDESELPNRVANIHAKIQSGLSPAPSPKFLGLNTTQLVSVAASICLLAIFTMSLFKTEDSSSNQGLALEEHTKEISPVLSTDSVNAPITESLEENTKVSDKKESVVALKKYKEEKTPKREKDIIIEEAMEEVEEDEVVFVGDGDGYGYAPEPIEDAEEMEKVENIAFSEARTKKMVTAKRKERAKLDSDKALLPADQTDTYYSNELDSTQNVKFANGIGYLNQGNYPVAESSFDELLVDKPSSLELNYLQGISYLKQHKTSKARKAFHKAASISTTSTAQIDWQKLDLLLKKKKHKEALAYIQQFELKNSKITKK